jgi:hypothetical protein
MAGFRVSRPDAVPAVDNGPWNPAKRENKRFDNKNKITILKRKSNFPVGKSLSEALCIFQINFSLPKLSVSNLKKEVLDGGSTVNCKSL